MNTTNNVFIFGATGFIGKYLEEQFSDDVSVKVFGYSSKTCNLLSLPDVKSVFCEAGEADAIIIASAITRIKENTYESMLKNIQMIENCCRALSESSVGHITFLSTVDVYGIDIEENTWINEFYLHDPQDYYSISKITSEFLLNKACLEKSIPLSILRLSGVYGVGDNLSSTIGKMVRNALNDNEIVIYDKGENLRDYIYIDDLFKIIQSAIKHKKKALVNVATGKSYTIKEIAYLIKSLLPIMIEIKEKQMESSTENRVKHLQFDCSVFKKEFMDVSIGVNHYIKRLLLLNEVK